jgi:hypothetical protein
MKKIIPTLILSFFFCVQHSLSVIAPTNSQQVATNTIILKNSTGKTYKPNWFERTQQKILAKTVNQDSYSATGWLWKILLSVLCLSFGLLFFIGASSAEDKQDSRSYLLLAVGLSALGIGLIWNAQKRFREHQQAIGVEAQLQAEAHTKYLNSFVNKEKSVVIATFGSFYTSVSDGKGGEILRYDTKKNTNDRSTYDPSTKTLITTGIGTIIHYTEFYINASGVVYNMREGQRVE